MNDRACRSRAIKVCHLVSADLWAGVEVQVATLLSSLASIPDLELSAILLNDGRLATELSGMGIETHVIPETRFGPWSITRRLREQFERQPIHVLHTHRYKDNVLGALASARRSVRQVRTIHGTEPFSGFQALKMHVYQTVDHGINCWAVDRILAVSHDMAARLGRRFGADKVACIQNGIEIRRFRPSGRAAELRKELGLTQKVVLGTMGRLAPVKGLDTFLKAGRLVREQRSDVTLVLAGAGPLEAALRAQARAEGLDDAVVFLGHRSDAADILELMDVFVLPSLSEGLPMTLLEALALSRPVVASRVGGIPEVIEDGLTGLLVEPGKPAELARGCMTLINDGGFARRLGIAGRRRVESRFSAEVMAANVAEMYRTLVWSDNANEDCAHRLRTDRASARPFSPAGQEAQHRRCL